MLLEKSKSHELADIFSDLTKLLWCPFSFSVTPIPASILPFLHCRVWSSCERKNAPQHPSSFHCGPQHEGCQVRRLPGHCAFWTTGCHLSRFVSRTVAEYEDISESKFTGQP